MGVDQGQTSRRTSGIWNERLNDICPSRKSAGAGAACVLLTMLITGNGSKRRDAGATFHQIFYYPLHISKESQRISKNLSTEFQILWGFPGILCLILKDSWRFSVVISKNLWESRRISVPSSRFSKILEDSLRFSVWIATKISKNPKIFQKISFSPPGSGGRWCKIRWELFASLCFQIWSFKTFETLPKSIHYFAKVGLKICPKLNKPSKICPSILKFCPSCKIFAKSIHNDSRLNFIRLIRAEFIC